MKLSPVLIFINVNIFLISRLLQVHLETIFFGGNNSQLVLAEGEYYRLFTSIFLHINFIHLAVNMFSLWQIGNFLEGGMSKLKFLILYLLSGLGGSLFSVLFHDDNVISVGASGAIFGLIGALLSWSVLKKQWQITKIVLLNLLLNIFITLSVPDIDSLGHLGGFLTGLLLAIIFFSTGPNVVLVEEG